MINTRPTRPAAEDGTIVILSNRGPHDFVWQEGHWVAKPSSGGLASMIEPLARQPNVAWFCCVSEPPGSEAGRDALFTTAKDQTDPDLNVVPVPLPAGIYQDYYGEISNAVLWMLQHHLVGPAGYAWLDQKRHCAWDNYLEANRRMAEAVLATEIPVRAFLIQDYHLYALPELLRQRFPETPSLHFIHIPFPDPSMLKLLPKAWREAILRGLLGADVVGFQSATDVRAFLACCQELPAVSVDLTRQSVILRTGRTVRVSAFPVSADPDAVRLLQASPAVVAARQRLAAETRPLNVIRVDRLDPSKNQILGFSAFGRMLSLHPELHGKVRFLAFLIPSRTDLSVYRAYHDAVYEEIDAVNGRFRQSCGFDVIKVFYTNDRAQAFAAMEICDVLLVNSRQDGMSLAVKEWALLSTKPGALVVSETAGVADEVADCALMVCPLDIEGTAQALAEALALPFEQRSTWLEELRERIAKWTARDWLVSQLREIGVTLPEKMPQPAPAAGTVSADSGAIEREFIILNREGIHARPAAAFVRQVREFKSQIDIVKGGSSFPAKSILAVLTANLNYGSGFTLRAMGPDAPEAIDVIGKLLVKFQEEDL